MEIIYELESGYIVNNESQGYLQNADAKGKLGRIQSKKNILPEELVLYSVNVQTKALVQNYDSLIDREKSIYVDGVKAVRNTMLSHTDKLIAQSDRLTESERQTLLQFRQNLRDFNDDLELTDEHHSGAQVTIVLPDVPESLKKYNLFY